MASTSFPGNILNDGFYKLGYVTNDRDRAVEVLTEQFGIEEFVTFSPKFDVTTADGTTGELNMNCAFSAGRTMFIEVLQPVSGPNEIFADDLDETDEFQLKFHHVSVIVDDLEAVKRSAAALGIHPAIESHLDSGLSLTYMKIPGLGHWVEHNQYDGNSRSFLDSVAAKDIS